MVLHSWKTSEQIRTNLLWYHLLQPAPSCSKDCSVLIHISLLSFTAEKNIVSEWTLKSSKVMKYCAWLSLTLFLMWFYSSEFIFFQKSSNKIIIQISLERFFFLSNKLCFKDLKKKKPTHSPQPNNNKKTLYYQIQPMYHFCRDVFSLISAFTFIGNKKSVYCARGIKLQRDCFSSLCLWWFVSSWLQK